MSVSHHLVSPLSKNSFKRAILESGSAYYYTGNGAVNNSYNLNDAKKYSKEEHNCSGETWLKCLKNVDAAKLSKYNTDELYVDKPIEGDEFMPENAQKQIKTGKFHTNSQILAGIVNNEGTMYGRTIFNKIQVENITKPLIRFLIEKNFENLVFKRLRPKIDGKKLYEFYFKDLFADENRTIDQITLKRAFSAPLGDFIIRCPSYLFAQDYALSSEQNQVYFYTLTYNAKKSCEHWMGVCHGSQSPFVFGTPLSDKSFSKVDFHFSLLVMHIWSTFAKSG